MGSLLQTKVDEEIFVICWQCGKKTRVLHYHSKVHGKVCPNFSIYCSCIAAGYDCLWSQWMPLISCTSYMCWNNNGAEIYCKPVFEYDIVQNWRQSSVSQAQHNDSQLMDSGLWSCAVAGITKGRAVHFTTLKLTNTVHASDERNLLFSACQSLPVRHVNQIDAPNYSIFLSSNPGQQKHPQRYSRNVSPVQ